MISYTNFRQDVPTVELAQVVEFLDNKRKPITEKDRVAGPYPYYGANGVQDYVADWIFDEDLILLAEDGGHFENPDRGVAYKITGKTWVNNHAHVLRAKKIDVDYLKHVLKNMDLMPYVNGATRLKLTKSSAEKIKIPLPPLAQQQRIAAILDKAAEIKAKREQAIAKLDELAQSTFVEMFGELISKSAQTVNDFFEVNMNRYETNLNDTDSVSFVPMSAVSEISKAIEIEEARTYGEVKKGYTPIKRGDLIVAKITPCYENGKQAIANVSSQFAYGSTEFHTFRSSKKDLVTLLHYYLQTKNVMRQGAANMKGAAGQRRVPDSFFKSLPFALPATNDLNKFGAAIASQNKHRAEQIRQLTVIENTIQSLQHQAFTTGFAT